MGSEASSAKRLYATKRSYTPFVNDITNNNTVSDINGASSAEIEYDYIKSDYDGEDADEELRSDAEIREFFDEQVIYFYHIIDASETFIRYHTSLLCILQIILIKN
jgi:hypothetical protein